jgi:hypothetical protein
MQGIGSNPQPTHDDMALIPAQGRDPATVEQDVQDARAAEQVRRAAMPPEGPRWVYENQKE